MYCKWLDSFGDRMGDNDGDSTRRDGGRKVRPGIQSARYRASLFEKKAYHASTSGWHLVVYHERTTEMERPATGGHELVSCLDSRGLLQIQGWQNRLFSLFFGQGPASA